MESVTMYRADDGSIWSDESEARARDELIREIEAELDRLGVKPRPERTDFVNGFGNVQQPAGTRDRVLGFLRSKGAHRDSQGPVGHLLYRLHCMDDEDREWGQPYFASNPDKGEQQELPPGES